MNNPTTDGQTDRLAVEAVLSGDHEAFRVLVERYQRMLFGLLLMVTRSPSGAEEVAQDALVRAFRHLDAYDRKRPFYPWLSTIAVRLGQNWLRKQARITAREGVPTDAVPDPTADADPLGELIADEDGRRLWRAVAALPSGERASVLMHYRQGLAIADIAGALGVTAGTIKTLLHRGRRRLRQTLDAGDGRPGKDTI